MNRELADTSWVKPFIHNIISGDSAKGDEYMAEKMPYINRPFYKYCYVCDEASRNEKTVDYSILNFENDELFFQNPALFNDPFDCYLGFSQKEMLKAALVTAMKQQHKYTPEMRKAINLFFSADDLDGRSADTFDADTVRNTLQALMPLIVNSMTTDPAEEDSVSKQLSLLITEENIDLFMKMVNNRLTVADQQKMIDLMFSDDGLKSKIISNLKNKDSGDWILKAAQRDLKLKVETTPDSFLGGNESETPQMFDFFQMIIGALIDKKDSPELSEVRSQLSQLSSTSMEKCRELISSTCRITCLSERMDSPLMWSHYANKHFGFCLEYDFTHTMIKRYPDLNLAKIMLLPVIYSENRPLLSQALTNPKVMAAFMKKRTLPNSVIESIIYGLLFKSTDWSYEKEWRIIGVNMEKPVMKLPCARKVFLGANIEEATKERLLDIAAKKHIPAYQMYLSPDKYKFEYCKTN